MMPSTTVRDLGVLIDSDVAMRSHVSRTVSGCFAVLQQLRSIRRSVSDFVFHSLVVSLVMLRLESRLPQRNTCRTSCVSAQPTLVGSQCRSQTDTSIFSVRARHTNAARPMAADSRTHQFQTRCAHRPMPARLDATASFRLHPERLRFQLPPSPVVVILAASDPTYTAVHYW